MSNFKFLLILFVVVGCATSPTNIYVQERNKGVAIQFPDSKGWKSNATISVVIKYDKLYDDKQYRKRKLQVGVTRGLQAILSLPNFYAFGATDGKVRYESMAVNHKGNVCNSESLKIMDKTWQLFDASRFTKVCKLSHWERVDEFAFSDAILGDRDLNTAISSEPAVFKSTDHLRYKTRPTEMTATSIANPNSLNFELGPGRQFLLSFHVADQNYTKRAIAAYSSGSQAATASIIHTAIGTYKQISEWGVIIPNLGMNRYFRSHLPRLTNRQYVELSERVLSKLERFDLESLVSQCAGTSAADICIQKFPNYATEKLNDDKMLTKRMARYFATVDILAIGKNADPVKFQEFDKVYFKISDAHEVLRELWSFILLDNTTITPKRDGNIVKVTFDVDFARAMRAYKVEKIE